MQILYYCTWAKIIHGDQEGKMLPWEPKKCKLPKRHHKPRITFEQTLDPPTIEIFTMKVPSNDIINNIGP